jgi:hypothetical protein
MTEAEWLNEQSNSQAMVWLFRGTRVTRTKAGKRKLRLFACACCRLTWDLLTARFCGRLWRSLNSSPRLELARMSWQGHTRRPGG